uniref:Protein Wnt n=1 Tax=Phallusia mammillata TaxID=59560 RepID=A0A6F9DX65_9ASCI|nr:protein Wnt-7b [Phallusia mammillata]
MERLGSRELLKVQSQGLCRNHTIEAFNAPVIQRTCSSTDLQSKWQILRKSIHIACCRADDLITSPYGRDLESRGAKRPRSSGEKGGSEGSRRSGKSRLEPMSNNHNLRAMNENNLPCEIECSSHLRPALSSRQAKMSYLKVEPEGQDYSHRNRHHTRRDTVPTMQRKRKRRRQSLFPALKTWIYFLLCQDLVLSSVAAQGSYEICNNIKGMTPPQISMCEARPNTIIAVSQGMNMASRECKYQFRDSRWNCTAKGNASMYGPELRIGTKEAAFDGAIKSAGVLHAIVTACGKGSINGCGCDSKKSSLRYRRTPKRRSPHQVQRKIRVWRWGGCSADMSFGNNFSTAFVDAREIRKTDRSLMNLHNYEVGRRVVSNNLKRKCRCHGVSGSCTMSTCWNTLPTFREVGNILRLKFKYAKKVSIYRDPSRKRALSLMLKQPRGTIVTHPRKPLYRDLVYLRNSPLFCENNNRVGSFGTHGRQCDRDPKSPRNCNYLCCKRGYRTINYTVEEACDCRFFWCCTVSCASTCVKSLKKYTCY